MRERISLRTTLQAVGVGAEARVGSAARALAGNDGRAAWRILKLVAAYVPLDPEYPDERLEIHGARCRTGVLLSERRQEQTGDGIADAVWRRCFGSMIRGLGRRLQSESQDNPPLWSMPAIWLTSFTRPDRVAAQRSDGHAGRLGQLSAVDAAAL